MSLLRKLIGTLCCAIAVNATSLPSFIKPCSRSASIDQLSECMTIQAKQAQHRFANGIPEFGLVPLDPLTLDNISAKAGTFVLKSTNVVVKGLRKVQIREFRWNNEKKLGHIRLFGNLTFLSDYEADGRVILLPITGHGKLTCKMYDTDTTIKYKFKTYKDDDGVEHLLGYGFQPSQTYGNVKLHLSNILGGSVIGDTINQVLNENWRDLMEEVGPPFMKAVADKVHAVFNKMYSQIPYNEMFVD